MHICTNIQMNTEKKAKFHHALGDITRLKIIEYLIKEKCKCICHIADNVKKDQSTVFRHIQILKSAGLIETKKENKFLFCCIKDSGKIKKLLEE